MRIEYVPKRFNAEKLNTIAVAVDIINDYERQGFNLTLRQLYYQFVSKALIENSERSYKNLGVLISDARMAGYIDWDSIEDRTRFIRQRGFWDDGKDILLGAARAFHMDMWDNQSTHVEVWIEKDALIGVIEGVCNKYSVPHFSCRGYVSMSEMHGAAQRIMHHLERGQSAAILHLGDHDPSGVDMSRDIEERILGFISHHMGTDFNFELQRLALNMDQVKKYNPPPNPAKITDKRAKKYIQRFGQSSWELDALAPSVISSLIENSIRMYIDEDNWVLKKEEIENHRTKLNEIARNYTNEQV